VALGCRLSGVSCYRPTQFATFTFLYNVKSNLHDIPRTINSIKCLGFAAATSDNSHGVVLKCAQVWRNFYLTEEEKEEEEEEEEAMLTLALDFVLQAVCSLIRLHKRCQPLSDHPLSRRSWYMYYLFLSHGKNGFANDPPILRLWVLCLTLWFFSLV